MSERGPVLRRLSLYTIAGLVALVSVSARAWQESALDPGVAAGYFREAGAASDADGAKLWGVKLYGPMLFADPKSRSVVANQADGEGKLRQQGEVFIGKLTEEVNISNTAIDWAGVRWTMLAWPLPEERRDRVRLMIHELFHRVQDSIKLPASNPANNHLDTKDGRIWLRMEWRAVQPSLQERAASEQRARRQAIADAIYFRRHRQALHLKAAVEECALETNEGLAEYTGFKLSARSMGELAAAAGNALRRAAFNQGFTRSFAYATGPAYGALLDGSGVAWRQKLKAGDDLSAILQRAMAIRLPADSESEVTGRAARYDGDEIIAGETNREKIRKELSARNRARLIDGPVLILPVGDRFSYSFDPGNVVTLEDAGTVYPSARVTDEWGVLEVSDGVLMLRRNQLITGLRVVAPSDPGLRPVQGPGWKLELNAGWELSPGERKGDFVVRKK